MKSGLVDEAISRNKLLPASLPRAECAILSLCGGSVYQSTCRSSLCLSRNRPIFVRLRLRATATTSTADSSCGRGRLPEVRCLRPRRSAPSFPMNLGRSWPTSGAVCSVPTKRRIATRTSRPTTTFTSSARARKIRRSMPGNSSRARGPLPSTATPTRPARMTSKTSFGHSTSRSASTGCVVSRPGRWSYRGSAFRSPRSSSGCSRPRVPSMSPSRR